MKSPQLMRGYSSDDKQSTSINVQHGKIIRNGTYIQAHDACSSQSRMNIVRGRKCHGTRNIDKKRDMEKKNQKKTITGWKLVTWLWKGSGSCGYNQQINRITQQNKIHFPLHYWNLNLNYINFQHLNLTSFCLGFCLHGEAR